jgi:small-conductance mechanosensitive channel
VESIIRLALLVLIGIPLIRYISNFLVSWCTQRFSSHIGILVGHITFYGGLLFIGVNILNELGFNVTALLGAAGIVGVAIGFASQTSVSNIISGFFLLIERPFSIGDLIKSGDVTGIVESIDLLSVRLRMTDNKMVRLPNEMVLKHYLINLTYHPQRRVDLVLSVVCNENIDAMKKLVHELLAHDSFFLTHPIPIVMVNSITQQEFGSEIRLFLTIRVWVATERFTASGGHLMEQLKNECDKRGIVITAAQVN